MLLDIGGRHPIYCQRFLPVVMQVHDNFDDDFLAVVQRPWNTAVLLKINVFGCTNAGGIVEKDQIFKWLDRSAI